MLLFCDIAIGSENSGEVGGADGSNAGKFTDALSTKKNRRENK